MDIPRWNAWSYWITFPALTLLVMSTLVGNGAATSWTIYPPLRRKVYHSSYAVDLVIFSLHLRGLSSLVRSTNYLTGFHGHYVLIGCMLLLILFLLFLTDHITLSWWKYSHLLYIWYRHVSKLDTMKWKMHVPELYFHHFLFTWCHYCQSDFLY